MGKEVTSDAVVQSLLETVAKSMGADEKNVERAIAVLRGEDGVGGGGGVEKKGKPTQDEKVAGVTDWFLGGGTFMNVMINEEIEQSYGKISNAEGEVAGWRPISRVAMESVIARELAKDREMRKAGTGGRMAYVLEPTGKNAKMVAETIIRQSSVDKVVRQKGVGLTLIHENAGEGRGLYFSWDKGLVGREELERGEEGVGGEYCFRRFFDGSPIEKEVRRIIEEGEGEKVVREWAERAHKEGLAWLRGRKKYEVRFGDTFWLWADEDKGTYMDILSMACMPLVRKKAEKAFFLLGEKANGKSVMRQLLRWVYGDNNCAAVQMSQIGDWSYAGTLDGKVLNFPDEEENTVEGFDKSSFKTMATHGDMVVRRKGSSYPLPLKCDFVSVSPINSSINWDKVDGGVASRVLIIPFNHSFVRERESGEGGGWAERRYTSRFCLEVLGELMGLAWAYNDWAEDPGRIERGEEVWKWSEGSKAVSREWESENQNVGRFIDEMGEVFVGYQSVDVLLEAYMQWVDWTNKEEGIDMPYQKDARRALKDICMLRKYSEIKKDKAINNKVHVRVGEDRTVMGQSLSRNQIILVPGETVGGGVGSGLVTRTIDELLQGGVSVVHAKRAGRKVEDQQIAGTVEKLF